MSTEAGPGDAGSRRRQTHKNTTIARSPWRFVRRLRPSFRRPRLRRFTRPRDRGPGVTHRAEEPAPLHAPLPDQRPHSSDACGTRPNNSSRDALTRERASETCARARKGGRAGSTRVAHKRMRAQTAPCALAPADANARTDRLSPGRAAPHETKYGACTEHDAHTSRQKHNVKALPRTQQGNSPAGSPRLLEPPVHANQCCKPFQEVLCCCRSILLCPSVYCVTTLG